MCIFCFHTLLLCMNLHEHIKSLYYGASGVAVTGRSSTVTSIGSRLTDIGCTAGVQSVPNPKQVGEQNVAVSFVTLNDPPELPFSTVTPLEDVKELVPIDTSLAKTFTDQNPFPPPACSSVYPVTSAPPSSVY